MTPALFINAARKYIGVRWHHMGRTREGVDCIGLLLLAAQDIGLPHPMPDPYARGLTGFDLCAACAKIGRQVPLSEAQDGDILVFATGVYPGHLGIRTTMHGIPAVLHAPVNRRRVVEEPLQFQLASSLRQAYRPTAFDASRQDVS